ncbi:helix-turn-helix domain-containing protein (plasmid) [Deinococcus radiomollis]|uniref:TetR/AcrR family transcriptional regulator n=1 Tax=Deinococcus radiomollis TaxID=468916 RepID=UPI003891F074
MARWQAGARDRLEQAALALFLEQGFAETTVPQIAARAGLTTRTFFRHFADKREVLFAGDEAVPMLVQRLMVQAPEDVRPVPLIFSQLGPFAETVFGHRRDVLRTRHRIISTDQGLRERKLQKMETLRASIIDGFVGRGTDELTATLAADLAMMVLGTALERWLSSDGSAPLSTVVTDVLAVLRTLASEVEREV